MSDEKGKEDLGEEIASVSEETLVGELRARAVAAVRGEDDLSEMALRIMESAMALFAKKGYAATSVREIVQAAKVTNPMLYYYFESKEGLFYKLIEVLFGEMEKEVQRTLELTRGENFKRQLREVIRIHLELAVGSPTALQFIYAVLFGPRDSRPDFDPLSQRAATFLVIFDLFEQATARGDFTPHEGLNTAFLVQQFFGMLNQYMLFLLVEHTRGVNPSVEPPFFSAMACEGEEQVERLLDFFLRGAGTVCER